MAEQALAGRLVLVAEDEYFLADDLVEALERARAEVLGPAPSVAQALALLKGEAPVDLAVLDVNMGGEMVFPLADALASRGIPFVFLTGYDECSLPDRFAAVPRLEKPYETGRLTARLASLFKISSSSSAQ